MPEPEKLPVKLDPLTISTKVKAAFAYPFVGAIIAIACANYLPDSILRPSDRELLKTAGSAAIASSILSGVAGYSHTERAFK
jgi:hypothetical protein